jgi:hypothetical protein
MCRFLLILSNNHPSGQRRWLQSVPIGTYSAEGLLPLLPLLQLPLLPLLPLLVW